MDDQYSTSKTPENSSPEPLNLRWRYFKSRRTNLLAKSFACHTLSNNSHFIEISEADYRRLEQEQQS